MSPYVVGNVQILFYLFAAFVPELLSLRHIEAYTNTLIYLVLELSSFACLRLISPLGTG